MAKKKKAKKAAVERLTSRTGFLVDRLEEQLEASDGVTEETLEAFGAFAERVRAALGDGDQEEDGADGEEE